MAYAAAGFTESCLRAMAGEEDVTDYAYVDSSVVEGLPFFASKVRSCLCVVSLAIQSHAYCNRCLGAHEHRYLIDFPCKTSDDT